MAAASDWWDLLSPIAFSNGNFTYFTRYQCDPFMIDPALGNKALTSASMARIAPMMVRGCSQFIVEYAGDYLAQTPATGAVTGACVTAAGAYNTAAGATDGEIDYIPSVIATGPRQIRWYGLPRDIDGDGRIPTGNLARNSPDVLPLRDVLAAYGIAAPGAPFEHFVPPAGVTVNPTLTARADYASTTAGMQSNEYYTVGWASGTGSGATASDLKYRPKLIRITMVIDDPAGRLGEGKTFEYVFKVP
jgi:hypothetical protein